MKTDNNPYNFIRQFKKIEKKLKDITGLKSDSVKFYKLINTAKKLNPVIEYKEGAIWDLYGLRNVFSHSDREKYIASINELAFITIKEILDLLDNPPTIGKFFKCKVFSATTKDITETVLRTMQKKLYTHVPVYKKKKFIGLLTETTLLDWLVENINKGVAQFYKKRVGDINCKYLNSKINLYRFEPTSLSIFDAMQRFEDAIDGDKRLGAILISNNGKKSGKLVGIITAWDLPRIKAYIK